MTKGMLLYLAPDKTICLSKELQNLAGHIKNKGSEEELRLIRHQLFALVYELSPISKTRKIVNEILELTELIPIGEKNKIMELIALMEEMCRPFLSSSIESNILVRSGI